MQNRGYMATIFLKSIQLDEFRTPCHPSFILYRHSTYFTLPSDVTEKKCKEFESILPLTFL